MGVVGGGWETMHVCMHLFPLARVLVELVEEVVALALSVQLLGFILETNKQIVSQANNQRPS